VVADPAYFLRVWNVFDLLPSFLIKQEQVHIIQEGTVHVVAHQIISTSSNENALIDRQVSHGVANPGAWGKALLLDLLPL
jgi:prephenate dehydratase